MAVTGGKRRARNSPAKHTWCSRNDLG
jgi:hypothetical protein